MVLSPPPVHIVVRAAVGIGLADHTQRATAQGRDARTALVGIQGRVTGRLDNIVTPRSSLSEYRLDSGVLLKCAENLRLCDVGQSKKTFYRGSRPRDVRYRIKGNSGAQGLEHYRQLCGDTRFNERQVWVGWRNQLMQALFRLPALVVVER